MKLSNINQSKINQTWCKVVRLFSETFQMHSSTNRRIFHGVRLFLEVKGDWNVVKSPKESCSKPSLIQMHRVRNFPWTFAPVDHRRLKEASGDCPWRNSDLAPFNIFTDSMQKGGPERSQGEASHGCSHDDVKPMPFYPRPRALV